VKRSVDNNRQFELDSRQFATNENWQDHLQCEPLPLGYYQQTQSGMQTAAADADVEK